MFKSGDPDHSTFLPVRDWVFNGHGKFVLGGTQYFQELSKISTVLAVLKEYEKMHRLIKINNEEIDRHCAEVKAIEPSPDFDDPHLVALVRATGCKLVCVRDPRSHRFLKAVRFYASSKLRPKLYTQRGNSILLCPKNIASCCK